MPDISPAPSRKVFDRETAEALARSLKEYPREVNEDEQLILDVMMHWLNDPIERLKLGPHVQFSEEEEAILERLEQDTRRAP